jgi:uncharacterized membrane protein HdeD (DUF308 family)
VSKIDDADSETLLRTSPRTMRLINNGVLRQGNLMATTISPNLQEIRDRSLTAVHTHWKMLFFIGVLMLFLGILAITLPTFSTLEIDILVGWLLCVGGIARIVTLYGKQHLPGLWWSIFSGFIAIVAGVLLVTRPIQGTMTLTMLLAAYFLIEGITTLYMTFLQRRHSRTRMWTLCGGLINVAMARDGRVGHRPLCRRQHDISRSTIDCDGMVCPSYRSEFSIALTNRYQGSANFQTKKPSRALVKIQIVMASIYHVSTYFNWLQSTSRALNSLERNPE